MQRWIVVFRRFLFMFSIDFFFATAVVVIVNIFLEKSIAVKFSKCSHEHDLPNNESIHIHEK